MSTRRPFLVIVPGGSQNPSQYALFAHLLLSAGYPVYTGLLPSVGTTSRVTTTEDTAWVRDHMIIPALDREERDVIIITHSYGSVPGSAAALGLDKASRAKEGKKTGVIGQIHIAGTIHKGGDGKSIVESFGGEYPPHLQVDVSLLTIASNGLPGVMMPLNLRGVCRLRTTSCSWQIVFRHYITM